MIQKNKAVLRFLGVFLLSYIVLTAIYSLYLRVSGSIDRFTQLVSDHAVGLLRFFGISVTTVTEDNLIALFFDQKLVAYVAEGCNAASVQILFIAFVLAFARRWKATFSYIVFGVLFIYIINIFRIVAFTILLHHYPQYTSFLHDIFFPAIIYGSVFLLWMNWVRLFQKEKNNG